MSDRYLENLKAESKAAIAETLKHDPCCQQPNENQTLFYVWNTANNKLLVLATSPDCAVYLARRSGHIKANANGVAREVPSELASEDNAFAGSLRRALKAGEAGCIKRVGDFATIPLKGRVYSPIASAD